MATNWTSLKTSMGPLVETALLQQHGLAADSPDFHRWGRTGPPFVLWSVCCSLRARHCQHTYPPWPPSCLVLSHDVGIRSLPAWGTNKVEGDGSPAVWPTTRDSTVPPPLIHLIKLPLRPCELINSYPCGLHLLSPRQPNHIPGRTH